MQKKQNVLCALLLGSLALSSPLQATEESSTINAVFTGSLIGVGIGAGVAGIYGVMHYFEQKKQQELKAEHQKRKGKREQIDQLKEEIAPFFQLLADYDHASAATLAHNEGFVQDFKTRIGFYKINHPIHQLYGRLETRITRDETVITKEERDLFVKNIDIVKQLINITCAEEYKQEIIDIDQREERRVEIELKRKLIEAAQAKRNSFKTLDNKLSYMNQKLEEIKNHEHANSTKLNQLCEAVNDLKVQTKKQSKVNEKIRSSLIEQGYEFEELRRQREMPAPSAPPLDAF